MIFRVLGSLEAEADGVMLRLGTPFQHKLLAILLLDAGHIVPLARLVDALWDDAPPVTAAKQVRNAVSRLRSLLTEAGSPDLISTGGSGYRLDMAADELDARVFESAVTNARDAAIAGHADVAAALLRSGLDLWRGPFLAGMSGWLIESASARWDERRHAAAEAYYDHQLTLGRHAEVVGELAALVAEHPLREKPLGQLMLALHRCGRQADALAWYGRARALLADGLGLDPGRALQSLHQQILADDPALSARDGERLTTRRVLPLVPRQLPCAVLHFVARQAELAALTDMLDQARHASRLAVIFAIGGSAGVGKTALAVHFAHQVAASFPDGQLYVDLHGFGPTGSPMSPAEAVRGFLDALGVAPERIPASLDAQAGLYRSLLADRRVLVVLDNARNAGQVRSLLPGGMGCMAVVTSRDRLVGLIAAQAAQPLTLDLLTLREACQLLASRIGADRTVAESEATEEIAALCSRLPLALSIVAAHAAAHPWFPLAALADELRRTPCATLDSWDGRDEATSVRAVFSWSCQQLGAPTARLFRLLGLHPGPDITAAAAASLAGVPPPAVPPLLAELARASLINEHVPGRFALHDLLRGYAAELARVTEREPECEAAVRRMLDHYLHTAHAAALLLDPRQIRRPVIPLPPSVAVAPERLVDKAAALAWFEAEHQVLLTVTRQAAASGRHACAWQLPWSVWPHLAGRGYWHDLATFQRIALEYARQHDDRQGQAHARLRRS